MLSVVLYSGRQPWRAATELAELSLPPPAGLEAYQPKQKYLLVEQHWNQSVDVHSNVLAIVFQLLRSQTDAELRAALKLFAERVKAPDLQPARESLLRWLQTTLRLEFSELNVDMEEKMGILFDQRFKRYEDLLEYEAIEKGRKKGLQEGVQQAVQEILQINDSNDESQLPVNIAEKINAANPDQLREWIKSLARGVNPRQLFGPG